MYNVFEKVRKEGFAAGRAEGISIGRTEGLAAGKAEVSNLILSLNNILINSGRIPDLIKASSDRAYREQLIKEFGLE